MTTLTGTSPRLIGRTIPLAALTPADRGSMFALLSTYFAGVDEGTFAGDLAEKSHVILLDDDRALLRGFSTLLVYRSQVPGVDATIVYSGDTIVDRDCWGSPALPVAWLAAVRSLTAGATGDVYWLLLTSGFRTYRFLPVFFREFCPRHDSASSSVVASSASPKTLVDVLANERFGERYDPVRGIVRFAKPQVLVPELLEVPSGRMLDEHVAFFLARNPGYTSGDELVCLTRIGEANLTPAGRRIARTVEKLTQ